jgi:hypothetical protein
LILYRHQPNISRLLQGTENKWKMDNRQEAESTRQ